MPPHHFAAQHRESCLAQMKSSSCNDNTGCGAQSFKVGDSHGLHIDMRQTLPREPWWRLRHLCVWSKPCMHDVSAAHATHKPEALSLSSQLAGQAAFRIACDRQSPASGRRGQGDGVRQRAGWHLPVLLTRETPPAGQVWDLSMVWGFLGQPAMAQCAAPCMTSPTHARPPCAAAVQVSNNLPL